jgi:hypothetical protein
MYTFGRIRHAVRSDIERHELGRSALSSPTIDYVCGGCGKQTFGAVVADAPFMQGPKALGLVHWCYCKCGQPSVIRIFQDPDHLQQWPAAIEFSADAKWPDEMARLFDEAASCFSANAFTASAMLCRKILMVCAVKEHADDDKSFAYYVDYITNKVLTYPVAKSAIDGIGLPPFLVPGAMRV